MRTTWRAPTATGKSEGRKSLSITQFPEHPFTTAMNTFGFWFRRFHPPARRIVFVGAALFAYLLAHRGVTHDLAQGLLVGLTEGAVPSDVSADVRGREGQVGPSCVPRLQPQSTRPT